MNAEQLLQHFERISEAPDAMKRLRRFILDLAVCGKLVEQDPSDEPASELLERIAAEKARLVKAGEIRKPKPSPPINKEDLPVAEEIAGWTWIRLGEVSTLVTKGSTPTSYGHAYTNEGIKFIKVESIKKGLLRPENITSFISDETNQFLSRSRLAHGDILFSIAGSIGTCAVVTEIILPANTNQACAIIRGTQSAFVSEFLLNSLQSSVASSVLEKARGGAMNNVSLEDIKNFVVPLPPLAEQHRIVAKVDELMALCDQLEAAKAEREKCRDSLVAASLQGLNQLAEEKETFREHAGFALDNLPRITTKAVHIKQLRQSILNLAVRGKLVEQVPGDELELANTPSKININLPLGWQSGTVFDLAALKSGNSFPSEKELSHGEYIYVKVSDMNLPGNQYEITTSTRFISPNKQDLKSLIPANSIIFPKRGGAIATNKKRLVKMPIFVDSNVMAIVCPPIIQLSYLCIWFLRIDLWDLNSGTSVPQINNKDIGPLVVLVPPLAEQHRIVAKVDELMSLCDQLEAQITATEQDSRRFLESVLADALAPGIDLREVAEVA